jgi:hypothetical protein
MTTTMMMMIMMTMMMMMMIILTMTSRLQESIRLALELGVDSVMVDGSAMPYDDNVAWTAERSAEAHAKVKDGTGTGEDAGCGGTVGCSESGGPGEYTVPPIWLGRAGGG